MRKLRIAWDDAFLTKGVKNGLDKENKIFGKYLGFAKYITDVLISVSLDKKTILGGSSFFVHPVFENIGFYFNLYSEYAVKNFNIDDLFRYVFDISKLTRDGFLVRPTSTEIEMAIIYRKEWDTEMVGKPSMDFTKYLSCVLMTQYAYDFNSSDEMMKNSFMVFQDLLKKNKIELIVK